MSPIAILVATPPIVLTAQMLPASASGALAPTDRRAASSVAFPPQVLVSSSRLGKRS
jgi:hypothetical protein